MNRLRRSVAAFGLAAALAAVSIAHAPASSAAGGFPNHRNPIVLVHGFTEDGSMWGALKQALAQDGYTGDQITAITYDTYTQSNVTTAEALGKTVRDVLSRTGAAKVDIVSHSMGGLNSRYCVKFAGCAGVTDHWISLSGANKGTTMANLCTALVTCREMVPGSAVLSKLNAAPALPAGTKWATLWTPNDRIIVPPTNTPIDGAENIEVTTPGVTHTNIFRDPGVLDSVRKLLAS
ncbi:esterase/lipase family protein [Amycolatopsis sp. NPDC059027]|uniref:esterase/lipase family protein n=1 Tax=unclassified Amycolatopsis TaxID=2618356 RepID=UPI00366C62DB